MLMKQRLIIILFVTLASLSAAEYSNHYLTYEVNGPPTGVDYVKKKGRLTHFTVGPDLSNRLINLTYILNIEGDISFIIQKSYWLRDKQANRLKQPIEEETVVHTVVKNKIIASTSKFKPDSMEKVDLLAYGKEIKTFIEANGKK